MRKDRGFARLLKLSTAQAPDELAYLVKEVQTLKGEIEKMERALIDLPEKIKKSQAVLAAVQMVLDRHPVKVEFAAIPSVKRNAPRLLPYGKVTQHILRTFREHPGQPLTTFAVAVEVAKHAELVLSREDFRGFKFTVLSALNSLRTQGVIESPKDHVGGGAVEAVWMLVKQTQQLA